MQYQQNNLNSKDEICQIKWKLILVIIQKLFMNLQVNQTCVLFLFILSPMQFEKKNLNYKDEKCHIKLKLILVNITDVYVLIIVANMCNKK